MRIVEVIAPARHAKELMAMARFYGAEDCWWGALSPDDRQALRMLVPDRARQQLLDGLQSLLDKEEGGRIVIQTVNATLPRAEAGDEESAENKRNSVAQTREELYTEIAKGAQLDRNFLLLVVLSTVVASIGLAEDNVAVVVGAMVIAPLLGPNIAFAFATSLGDRRLSVQALAAGGAGLGLALLLALLIGLIWPINLDSHEIMTRTEVGLDSVALALASGTAAVLSLTTGLSSALVGVMVAVALLPPVAVMGLQLGHGRWELALGAGLLLAVNIVCVLLSAKVVFLIKGVHPRGWIETRKAKYSMSFYIALWAILLAILISAMLLRSSLSTLVENAVL
ncbi:TIGR00341 family protein [Rhabdochromatium marinum]|uniref:TIGR00341 family protein n=1 Tax=Rhabdochromatium marinum TaxID=48729 RepID=UPI0019065CB5|nr:TIGR00341 family protein [Rhabdochromatium marinum]MBK1647080.1 TIGR00341 family protein [Rhabdochromatium marinum]